MIFDKTDTFKALLFSAFLALGAAALPATAMADEGHDSDTPHTVLDTEENEMFDKNGVAYTGKYAKVIGEWHTLSLIRKPYLSDEQFILRISGPVALSGCLNATDFGFEASYTEYYMDITLKPAVFDMRNQPQYAHYECDMTSKLPVADIVLDKQMLLDKGTKVMRIHVGNETNYFNVNITDDRVLILPDENDVLPKKFRLHDLPMRDASTIYWFYPMGTLVIWTPQIMDQKKAQEYAAQFAQKHGLVPLNEYLEDFKSPLYDKKFTYYVDTSGRFDDVEGLENGTQIGNITVETVKYGLEGDEIDHKDIMIFARKPGIYD